MDSYKAIKGMIFRISGVIMPLVQRNRALVRLLTALNDRLNARLAMRSLKTLEAARATRHINGGFGVNVAGYITSESGVGEAARAEIRAVERAGVPRALIDIKAHSRQNDGTYKDFTDGNPYAFNLVHVNADLVQDFFLLKGLDFFRDKYNIGFWFWELSEFPPVWHNRFRFFDEIWAASGFCADAFGKHSPVPVVKIPLSIELGDVGGVERSRFGLEEDAFVFLFVFDFFSFFERKNPLAVIESFRLAFGEGRDCLLVLKCSNSKWNTISRDAIIEAAYGLNFRLIDDYLDKRELQALVSLCDCYVSLHRSEGFGIPLAEAMCLGKPVIATGYSGNMEFMNGSNSFPVRYRLVEIEKDFGPYRKGYVWAEPDIAHAAELMRLVYEKRDIAGEVGRRASEYIKANLSPEAVGARILERLEAIAAEKGVKARRI